MSSSEKRTATVKVPCGGFKLDNNFLSMNENDELSLTGGSEGKAYQYVVTDGDGNTKWEDRLAYEGGSRLVVPFIGTVRLVKVADEAPSWASVDASIKIWVDNGNNSTVHPEDFMDMGNGSFAVGEFAFIITTDNVEFNSIVFPEKGVYFAYVPDNFYVAGIASADSDTPEITWDGNVSVIKKLDEKFIPDIPAEKLPDIPAEKLPDIPAEKLPDIPAPVIEVDGSFYSSIENASQPSYTVKNLSYSDILSIFNSKNFVIKDADTYYRPTDFEIATDGDLFVQILVNRISASGNMVVADLTCSNGKRSFYRNKYGTIAGTKQS